MERRQGQHNAVHRLSQVYADLVLAEKELVYFEDSERKHRCLCFIRDAYGVVKHVIDTDLGPKLVEDKV